LVFALPRLAPSAVLAARLTAGRHTRSLGLSSVRAALRSRTLRVRPPRWARSAKVRVRLVLLLAGTPAPRPTATTPRPPPVSTHGPPTPASADPLSDVLAPETNVLDIANGALLNPNCQPAYGTFAPGNEPAGCYRFYAASSAFNRQVPANAPLVANSAAMVRRLVGFGPPLNILAGLAGTPNEYNRPVYFSQVSDPTFTLHCTRLDFGTCPLEGMQIRVPDAAQAAGGSDGHMTVIDQTTGFEYDFWQVSSKPAGGGLLQFSFGGRTRVDGDGRGSGAVAAEYGTAAGLLREEELAGGSINHALFIAVNCDSGSAVYPATKGGARCADPTNAPPEGARFVLGMSDEQIRALAVPGWKKTILRAIAHYGLIVGDTGGTWGIASDSGLIYTSFGRPDKWVQFARQVGAPYYPPDNDYVFNMAAGVDYARYLRVVDPCVSQGTC
jgi:hypothetical protein